MKLIVGLGNPGREYVNTRHNIGFSLLDYIADLKHIDFCKEKFNGSYAEFMYNGEKVILLKPLSYMNLSGKVILDYINFYKIDLCDVLVIQDDLDMDFGRIKFVYNSSSGGHNGIKDIERCLNSRLYARLKIGIANNKNIETKDYVLSKFNLDELKVLEEVYKKLSLCVDDFCSLSLDKVMNKYNNK